MVYVSNLPRPRNLELVAKQYKVSLKRLEKNLSPDYKTDPHYRFYKGNHMESHLYEGIHRSELYDKLKNVLESSIALSKFDELEECFQLSINVFTMDIDSGKVDCIRLSNQ
ncbi:hypothetical protein L915_12426, partial [Phytophthora nicotianae]